MRLLWRSRRAPAYRLRWGERFGFVPAIPQGQAVIWVHSVSVGETLAAIPLTRRLQQLEPGALIAVTTMTPTGSERVRAAFGDSVYHVYAPYDLPGAVARFLTRVHPRQLIIMETELWPNIIHGCAVRDIPVVVANARLSVKSAAGYRRFLPLVSPMLGEISLVAAQTAADGERFLVLGLQEHQLSVTGNIKFDLDLSAERKQQALELASQWRGDPPRPVWLVASTHKGEDELILKAFKSLLEQFPDLLLVLVPRHPERFTPVYNLCVAEGLSVCRRSDGGAPTRQDQLLLGDTMGELPVFFGACDVAFVGGSLVATGGHNLIEPAAWGVPVTSGPHLFNFTEAASLLSAANGLEIAKDPGSLAEVVARLLNDDQLRWERGEAARGVAEANRGALDKLVNLTVLAGSAR